MTNRWSEGFRIHRVDNVVRPKRLPSRGVTHCPGSARFSASLAFRLRFVHNFFEGIVVSFREPRPTNSF